ncbi:hypothetical protein KYT87_09300 [Achromobacter sp. ES-001]|uniref:hypothetical protein n=1 Tax=Achromobacter sp. ES-001 TaxID=2860286 RepID=UPI001C6433E4|nr:hypothetical protein [Achromobacter sp. ES-001]QYJ23389.1 hypothetical protein KYT87_09300 [Achromobacter sp. ES-001]
MRERPILFSAPMVRALLAGTKTQTRRVVKGIDPANLDSTMTKAQWRQVNRDRPVSFGPTYFCPYGQPGDRLWVRETWAQNWDQLSDTRMDRSYVYRADGEARALDNGVELPWRPSIHMPRSACRLVLEITGVRVERLHKISEADAVAEGIPEESEPCEQCGDCGWLFIGGDPQQCNAPGCGDGAIDGYRALWEQINGAGSWKANPWVWVVEFRVLATTDNKEQP